MKFSKLDLLTLLISLFLFSSCKDSSSIGLDIDPANAISGTLIDTVSITSTTEKDEASSTFFSAGSTSNPSWYPLGNMKDDIFGVTSASVAMSVNLPSSSYIKFATTAAIDSVVLVLPYAINETVYRAREFYGDSTATYNINVSQLTSNLSTAGSWLSSKTYPSGDVLGTFSAPIRPNTRFKVVDIVAGAADTAIAVVPELRIRLSAAMIKSKILNLDSASISTNAKFNIAFNGLKVSATASGKGGMMFLDFRGTSSNLEIYYKQPNTTTATQIDTLVARFPITTTTNAVAATVTHDYTNTPVAKQLSTPAVYPVTYLQSMSGLRNKITFPNLKNLVASVGSKMVINKAELVIDSSDPADSIPFKIPPRLSLYRLDIAGQRQNVPDNNPYSTDNPTGDIRTATSGIPFGGGYNYTKNSYAFVVTNYVQDIIDGKITDYGTYLSTTSLSTTATYSYLFPVPTTAGRVVIGSFNNPNNRKIRLNIYYVKTGTN